jgi:hypothetical protein
VRYPETHMGTWIAAGLAAVVTIGIGWLAVKNAVRPNREKDLGLVSQAWLIEQRAGKQSDRFS